MEPTLKIDRARVVASNGRSCNVTRRVERACEGKSSCSVRIDDRACGDLQPGTRKKVEIEYTCRFGEMEVTRRTGSTIGLTC